MLNSSLKVSLALTFVIAFTQPLAGETRLLRFPDLHENQVVFTYAGDLWLAPATGGTARRLTTHPGLELFGKFSPDGQWIAFTGQYDGDEQVYVVPTSGGAPRQLTFYPAAGPLPPRWGYDNQVYDWTADGQQVLFRSMRDGWDLGDTQLFLVSVDGGLPEALPMPESGGGALSPDGGQIVYSPVTRDFRHWKRYAGGWAQDLFILDRETLDTRQITDHPRSDRDPMWFESTIYFASDRSDVLNLYAFDTASGGTRQVTHSDVWDVRWPSLDGVTGRIVYELDGGLVVLDPASGEEQAIEIDVPTDLLASRPKHIDVSSRIADAGLSPKGERALFSARGDLFTVPIEHGLVRNLTRTPGAHDREPAWSPDGRRIAFVSDRDGEEEIWSVDQEGREEPQQLTDGSTGRYYDLQWSPDGEHLAYRNQQAKLFVLDVGSREVIEVADDRAAFGPSYDWSPDGSHLALTLSEDTGFTSVHIWRLADRSLHRVTGEAFNDFSPSFSPDGKYLFFISDREFRPQLGSFEFDYVVNRESYLYAVTLRQDVDNPFAPRSDEVTVEQASETSEGGEPANEDTAKKGKKEKAEPASADKNAEKKSEPLKIDWQGLSRRVVRIPVEADNYGAVVGIDGGVLYLRGGASYYGRSSGVPPQLRHYDFTKREETTLLDSFSQLALSGDRKKLLVGSGGGFRLVDAGPAAKGQAGKSLSLSGMAVDTVPKEEWAQIFDEVYRRFRDFFYVSNMHGYDWDDLRARYRPLLEHVAHRSDLNYVISEMIAELNVSHAYITGGDYEIPDRPDAALLGARFELDRDSGRYRIAHLFAGQNEEPNYRSPLTEVGVGVAAGDYVLEINGVELGAADNPFRLLRHAGEAPVELLVGKSPDPKAARRVLVAPIDDEDDLIYLEWVLGNRARVAERSGDRIGYIHIPDMGAAGLREWIKGFYGQVRKQGLVIDVRNNGGGNVSPMIIERLRREVLMLDFERNNELVDTYPGVVFHGHLVCLIDEDTASDGDQFAYVFRKAGLGPLIGKRTWGGVVGIYGRGSLIDGGGLSVPEAGSADVDGKWVIEGHGVEPDVEVANHPKELLEGVDQQLEKAIDVLLEQIEQDPMVLPERPASPIKTP